MYLLYQVGEGLAFLHNDVKLLHHNICLESIVVNQQGAWKIFGFDFCILNQEQTDGRVSLQNSMFTWLGVQEFLIC